ncbi:MAG: hypothetical protein PHT67_03045 [Candidatus Pacebacteria bacterium]|nr:hypothetical protein [Candidatus Paceibacterota bacterium]MDD5665481.1 hypothetical protein [Candidatus Omnitrophota bacterium]
MVQATTIKIDTELKHRLDTLKNHPRETYGEVIQRLTEMAIDSEPLSEETLGRIEDAIAEFRKGRFVREEDIDKLLGI